ncbi:MAG: flagellar basal body P-ring protein FlgI [Chitinivibrionales bacterium]
MKKKMIAAHYIVMLFVIMSCMQFCLANSGVRIKDVACISGLEDVQIFGYGLVVGLDGTGDRSQTIFTTQTIVNLLKNMGIELPAQQIRVQNVAAVMVTGILKPFKRKGTRFDVNVSSMGDATSLEGGTLLLTSLQGADGSIYASAQGPLATGGYDVKYKSLVYLKKNHVLVGRIPDGAVVQREYTFNVLDGKELSLSLASPDFSSAVSMANAINQQFKAVSSNIAKAIDAATVSLNYEVMARDSIRNFVGIVDFISKVENITFSTSAQARVVVNERTGTIVAGGDVRISEVAVSHGSIKVEVVNTPEVVQPIPYNPQSAITPNPSISVEEKSPEMVVLKGTTTVSDLSQALNSLGVAPRDVISIFQAIKEAGALQGQLIIM